MPRTPPYSEAATRKSHFRMSIAPVLHLIPKTPCVVLDIGAGTGRDAAALAELGSVVSLEPVNELRTAAMTLHPSPKITWIKDSLPDLAVVSAMNRQYDLAMLTPIWVHLDAEERERAMPAIAALMHDVTSAWPVEPEPANI